MTKKSVDLSEKCVEALEQCSKREGREPTRILRRALGLYIAATEKGLGGYVQITYPNGKERKYYMS